MTYVIDFDMPRSMVLNKAGDQATSDIGAAMTFPSQDAAAQYIEKHKEQVSKAGTGPHPSKLG